MSTYATEIAPYGLRAKLYVSLNFSVTLALFFNQYANAPALEALAWKYYIFVSSPRCPPSLLLTINSTASSLPLKSSYCTSTLSRPATSLSKKSQSTSTEMRIMWRSSQMLRGRRRMRKRARPHLCKSSRSLLAGEHRHHSAGSDTVRCRPHERRSAHCHTSIPQTLPRSGPSATILFVDQDSRVRVHDHPSLRPVSRLAYARTPIY